jgi:sigma-B regulation protein RsbU (phosphoserine phosphatase)
MRYANAGHPKPLHLRRSAGVTAPVVNASGKSHPALGLLEGARYPSSEITLAPSDFVLLYTDGLVEVQNSKGDLYTPQMLLAAAQQRLPLPAPQLLDDLLEEVRRFAEGSQFTDDVCVVGMDFGGALG